MQKKRPCLKKNIRFDLTDSHRLSLCLVLKMFVYVTPDETVVLEVSMNSHGERKRKNKKRVSADIFSYSVAYPKKMFKVDI